MSRRQNEIPGVCEKFITREVSLLSGVEVTRWSCDVARVAEFSGVAVFCNSAEMVILSTTFEERPF